VAAEAKKSMLQTAPDSHRIGGLYPPPHHVSLNVIESVGNSGVAAQGQNRVDKGGQCITVFGNHWLSSL
jgi:hypothetical protein